MRKGIEDALLAKHFDLSVDDFPTLVQATGALLWKRLGFDTRQPFSLKALKKEVFNSLLGTSAQSDEEKALHALLVRAVGARRHDVEELRAAALRHWIEEESHGAPPPEPPPSLDLEGFARRVLAAAHSSPSGRFGDNKVFIAHVWRAVCDDPAFQGMNLDQFKERLTEANHARLLDLSRADLVEAMDPEDVRTSEARYLGATFHFVRI